MQYPPQLSGHFGFSHKTMVLHLAKLLILKLNVKTSNLVSQSKYL